MDEEKTVEEVTFFLENLDNVILGRMERSLVPSRSGENTVDSEGAYPFGSLK